MDLLILRHFKVSFLTVTLSMTLFSVFAHDYIILKSDGTYKTGKLALNQYANEFSPIVIYESDSLITGKKKPALIVAEGQTELFQFPKYTNTLFIVFRNKSDKLTIKQYQQK